MRSAVSRAELGTHLRALSGILKSLPSRERWDFSLHPGGIPRGALTEISGLPGSGKSEVVLRFLAENPELRVAWVEEEFTVYPCAFPQQGVELTRVLFAEAGADALWTIQQILRSQLFGVVVASAQLLSEVHLRRLQLAAEQAQASVILLSSRPTHSVTWPITLQLRARRKSSRTILEIIKGAGCP